MLDRLAEGSRRYEQLTAQRRKIRPNYYEHRGAEDSFISWAEAEFLWMRDALRAAQEFMEAEGETEAGEALEALRVALYESRPAPCSDCAHAEDRHTAVVRRPEAPPGCLDCGCPRRPPFPRGTAAILEAINRERGGDPPARTEGYA